MSISELDQLLERRWPGKVRRGGALELLIRSKNYFKNGRHPARIPG